MLHVDCSSDLKTVNGNICRLGDKLDALLSHPMIASGVIATAQATQKIFQAISESASKGLGYFEAAKPPGNLTDNRNFCGIAATDISLHIKLRFMSTKNLMLSQARAILNGLDRSIAAANKTAKDQPILNADDERVSNAIKGTWIRWWVL